MFAGIFMAALLLSGVGGGNATAADDIRIGYTPSLTGIRAGQGANEIKAAQLAVKRSEG
jgi:predicted outer membrane protein